jgi:hypothetical protein
MKMITKQNGLIRNLIIGIAVIAILAVVAVSMVLNSNNTPAEAPASQAALSQADAEKIVCEANGIYDVALCAEYLKKMSAATILATPAAVDPNAQRSANADLPSTPADPYYVPVSIQAHGTLFDNWKDPTKVPTVARSEAERFLVISADPCVYTLQDENGITVWEYDTSSINGSLALLRIPAKYTLYVTMYNWQPNAIHWPISGAAYATLADATQAWQLIHFGEFAEIKPIYIDNIGSDLRVANVSANKPARTLP